MESSNNNNNIKQNQESNIRCCICLDKFSEKHVPVLLPCFHTIGLPCAKQLLDAELLKQCPLCRKPMEIKDVNKLKVNDIILEIVELLSDEKEDEAIVYCGECEEGVSVAIARCNHENCGIELCDLHLAGHQRSRTTRTHEISQFAASRNTGSADKCHVHPGQNLSMYCKDADCGKLICGDCFGAHSHSNVIPIQKWVDDNKKTLNEFKPVAAKRITECQKFIADETRKLSICDEQRKKAQVMVENYFNELTKAIQAIKTVTLDKFNASYSKSEMKWKKQLDNLKLECDIALELDKLVDATTTSSNIIQIGQTLNMIDQQIAIWNGNQYSIPIESVHIECKSTMKVDELVKQIQDSLIIDISENGQSITSHMAKWAPNNAKYNEIYSCGYNDAGQLGLKTQSDDDDENLLFKQVAFPEAIIQIACGNQHTLALSGMITLFSDG